MGTTNSISFDKLAEANGGLGTIMILPRESGPDWTRVGVAVVTGRVDANIVVTLADEEADGTRFGVVSAESEVELELGAWRSIKSVVHRPSRKRTRIIGTDWRFDDLMPDQRWKITVSFDGKHEVEAWTRTLPQMGELTLLAGSCYDIETDPDDEVGTSLERGRRKEDVVHGVFLMGDQVYVDSPWFRLGSPRRLRPVEHIARKYVISFGFSPAGTSRLGGLVQSGPVWCTADDHEFWNDYPNESAILPQSQRLSRFGIGNLIAAPSAIAAKLMGRATPRRKWEDAARGLMEIFQGRQPFRSVVAAGIAIMVVDARVDRTSIDSDQLSFMQQHDFDALVDALDQTQEPVLLFLSQPLLYPDRSSGSLTERWRARSRSWLEATDHNLSDYTPQYRGLWNAIYRRYVDERQTIVVTGDVHHTRVAATSDRRFVEISGSPISLVKGAKLDKAAASAAELGKRPPYQSETVGLDGLRWLVEPTVTQGMMRFLIDPPNATDRRLHMGRFQLRANSNTAEWVDVDLDGGISVATATAPQ